MTPTGARTKQTRTKLFCLQKQEKAFYRIQVIDIIVLKTLTSYWTLDFHTLAVASCVSGSLFGLLHGGQRPLDLMSPLYLNITKNGISACIQLYYKSVAMNTGWKWTCLELLRVCYIRM